MVSADQEGWGSVIDCIDSGVYTIYISPQSIQPMFQYSVGDAIFSWAKNLHILTLLPLSEWMCIKDSEQKGSKTFSPATTINISVDTLQGIWSIVCNLSILRYQTDDSGSFHCNISPPARAQKSLDTWWPWTTETPWICPSMCTIHMCTIQNWILKHLTPSNFFHYTFNNTKFSRHESFYRCVILQSYLNFMNLQLLIMAFLQGAPK